MKNLRFSAKKSPFKFDSDLNIPQNLLIFGLVRAFTNIKILQRPDFWIFEFQKIAILHNFGHNLKIRTAIKSKKYVNLIFFGNLANILDILSKEIKNIKKLFHMFHIDVPLDLISTSSLQFWRKNPYWRDFEKIRFLWKVAKIWPVCQNF